MAHSGAHRRVALTMVQAFGAHSSRRLVLGFMAAAAVLSMWISNTATTLMLLPVALAVLERAPSPALATPLLLGIAFSASVGGVGTPIGTPPNLIFMQVYENTTGTALSFLDWMGWGVPVVLVMIPVLWLWLTRKLGTLGPVSVPSPGLATRGSPRAGGFCPHRPGLDHAQRTLRGLERSSGYARGQRRRSGLHRYRRPLPHSRRRRRQAFELEGGGANSLGNAAPLRRRYHHRPSLRGYGHQRSPRHPALGSGVLPSGDHHGRHLPGDHLSHGNDQQYGHHHPHDAHPSGCRLGAGLPPELLMVPAAMSASCAFMMPVATAPNAIMFGTGRFTTRTMASEGVVLNLLGAVVITTVLMLVL